jgi:predicted dehydrogenase
MNSFFRHADTAFGAVCDVDEARLGGDIAAIEKREGKRPEVFRDYRKLLERKDIDAVIIATPDHWHALNLIDACQAGKDIYCEKPISHNIVEAVSMVGAARATNRVVQVGTWQRSSSEFCKAIELVRSGKLGKIVLTRAWITDGFRAGRQKGQNPPSSLDYDFWTGPAELIPYRPNHVHFNWRWFMNYGGGMTTDWGVHMMDIALLGLSQSTELKMPTHVSALGGLWAITDDDRTAPDSTEAIYRFGDENLALHWWVGRDHPNRPGHGTEFVSADGRTLRVWRGGWQVLDPEGKAVPMTSEAEGRDHWREFLDCVKSRKQPSADLASVAQTTIVCHLANVSLQAKQPVEWDPEKMDLVGRAGRNTQAYRRAYRSPWKLETYKWSGR